MKNMLIEFFTPALQGKKILIGMSGSIAAFKVLDLIRSLKACGADVRVVLTASAQEFVTKTTLETISENPVLTSLWGSDQGTHHIETARWADLIVCAPATANLISKLAWGVADDLLTTEILAFRGPLFIAPAMNPQMFETEATQKNIQTLRTRKNIYFCGPESGITACQEVGLGRMSEPEHLLEAIASYFYEKKNGKKALVNFGPTVSFYDPVRFLSNRSSGKMGVAFIWALQQKGYEVTAIGNNFHNLPLPVGVDFISTQTTQAMAEHVIQKFPLVDLMVAAAAVLDFEFDVTHNEKIKKENWDQHIHLKKTIDILSTLGEKKNPTQFLMGFAAETSGFNENGLAKKNKKKLDAVFVNDISNVEIGFESTENAGLWIGQSTCEFQKESKFHLARRLVDQIESEWNVFKKQEEIGHENHITH